MKLKTFQKVSLMVNMWSSGLQYPRNFFHPIKSQYSVFHTKAENQPQEELTKQGNRVSCAGQRPQAVLLSLDYTLGSPEAPQATILGSMAGGRLPVWLRCAVRVQNHWTQGHSHNPAIQGWKKLSRQLEGGPAELFRHSSMPPNRTEETVKQLERTVHSIGGPTAWWTTTRANVFKMGTILVLLRIYWSLTS